jgi:putative transcriptional regulator
MPAEGTTPDHHAQGPDELLHIASCDACAELALAVLPAPISPAHRTRLLASLDHLERFASMAPRLAELADLSTDEARRALHAFERPEELPPTPMPGLRLIPLPTGPRLRTAEAVLACFAPGARFPRHTHHGEERILIFQGALRTDDGQVVRAGEELRSPTGSTHAIALVLGDEPCLCAILNGGRIEVTP